MSKYHRQWVRVFMLPLLLGLLANSHAQPSQPFVHADPANADALKQIQTCRGVAARSTSYRDGRYWLRLQGQAVLIYCHDMIGDPREYLDLPEGNCSEYTSLKRGIRRVQTCFQRVRLDPETLRVDIGDLTFSQTHQVGTIKHDNAVVNAMPYATAMSCDDPGFPAGKASITLTGTGFDIVDTFKAQGYLAKGEVSRRSGLQQWEVRGGGFCGWMAPGNVYNPHFSADWNPLKNRNGFLLQLRMLGVEYQ